MGWDREERLTHTLKGGGKNMNQNEQIEEYVALFNAIEARIGDDETARVILGQLGKDRRMSAMKERERSNGKADPPATEKQLGLIRRLGGTPRPGLSKREASEEIDRLQQFGQA